MVRAGRSKDGEIEVRPLVMKLRGGIHLNFRVWRSLTRSFSCLVLPLFHSGVSSDMERTYPCGSSGIFGVVGLVFVLLS